MPTPPTPTMGTCPFVSAYTFLIMAVDRSLTGSPESPPDSPLFSLCNEAGRWFVVLLTCRHTHEKERERERESVCVAPHARVRVGASPHVNTRVRVYGQRSVVSPTFVRARTHTHRRVCACTQVCLCQCARAHGRTADFAKLLTTIPSTLVDSTTPHISLTCAQPDTRAAMIIPSFPRTLERKFSSATKTLQTCRVRECVFMCVRCVCV